MKSDRGDGKVNRRVVLALATLPLLGLRKAEAMTDAEEIVKLQAEAARIQEIFDVQKAASANLPSLKDSLKVAKSRWPKGRSRARTLPVLCCCACVGHCGGSELHKRAVCLSQTSRALRLSPENLLTLLCAVALGSYGYERCAEGGRQADDIAADRRREGHGCSAGQLCSQ